MENRPHKGNASPPQESIVLSPDSFVARGIIIDTHFTGQHHAAPYLVGLLLAGNPSISIPQGHRLFTTLEKRCIPCKIFRLKRSQALMGSSQDPKMTFRGPMFDTVADAAGPFSLLPHVKST